MSNWKNTVLALSLASLVATPGLAQDSAATSAGPVTSTSAQTASATAAEAADQIITEATDALAQTDKAIAALEAGDSDGAAEAIDAALAKLDKVKADNPSLDLAPVTVGTELIDTVLTPDEITSRRDAILRLIKDHQLQSARLLISGLASEVVISTASLPMDSFPLALKSAAALIGDSQPDDAKAVLYQALGSLSIVETAVPLPLVNAVVLIDEAKALSEKADRSDDDNARLARLLDELDTEIARGAALEYGDKESFDAIRDEMKEIRRKTANGGAGAGFFDKIRGLYDRIGHKNAAARK